MKPLLAIATVVCALACSEAGESAAEKCCVPPVDCGGGPECKEPVCDFSGLTLGLPRFANGDQPEPEQDSHATEFSDDWVPWPFGCSSDADCRAGEVCLSLTDPNNPIPHCVLSRSGHWTDPSSGLTWQKWPVTFRMPPPLSEGLGGNVGCMCYCLWDLTLLQKDAETYCESIKLDGYDDWRLPTIEELRTLVRGCTATESGGTCDTDAPMQSPSSGGACGGCPESEGPSDGCYWSGELEGVCAGYLTVSPGKGPGLNWAVEFRRGELEAEHSGNTAGGVRCVRQDQALLGGKGSLDRPSSPVVSWLPGGGRHGVREKATGAGRSEEGGSGVAAFCNDCALRLSCIRACPLRLRFGIS